MNHGERCLWDLVESVSILFMRGYLAARARAFEHPMPMVRLLAQRDHAHSDAVLLERELAIYRSQRQRKPAKQRPHYTPQERAEILQLIRLRGWSSKEAAACFVVHPNTIRNLKKSLREKHRSEVVVGALPWNKLHGACGGSFTRCDSSALSGTLDAHHRPAHHAVRDPDQQSLGTPDPRGGAMTTPP